jgi:hypothetical protein
MTLLVNPKLLILDEMGNLSLEPLPPPPACSSWSVSSMQGLHHPEIQEELRRLGSIFADNVIASAVLDRMVHHSSAINIKGESYRLQGQEKRWRDPKPKN